MDWFWFYEGYFPDHLKERVLPHGALELVIDLQSEPKRLFDREDHGRFRHYRRSWISGAQSEFIVIEATANSSMMGIHFKPGGAYLFFGFPISELQDSVVELDAIWGSESLHLREQLLEVPNLPAKFRVLEDFLIKHARKSLLPARAVAFALREFEAAPEQQVIRNVAERLGMSHKHLIQEFSNWVGLTPKLRFYSGAGGTVQQAANLWLVIGPVARYGCEPRHVPGRCQNRFALGPHGGNPGGGRLGGRVHRHCGTVREQVWTYIAINGGYQIVAFAMMGAILGAWR